MRFIFGKATNSYAFDFLKSSQLFATWRIVNDVASDAVLVDFFDDGLAFPSRLFEYGIK